MQPQRRRKKRVTHSGALRTVEVTRSRNGYGFTISGQNPCILSCIVSGSPADRTGLKTGDHLIAVNGQNVSRCTHDDVVRLIGSSRGVLLLQIAENLNSSDSSDEEYHKSKSKYPPNRARLRQGGQARIEKVVAEVHAGIVGRGGTYTLTSRDGPSMPAKKSSAAVKSRSRSPLKEWTDYRVNSDKHQPKSDRNHSVGMYPGVSNEASQKQRPKKHSTNQPAAGNSSINHASYAATKHLASSSHHQGDGAKHRSHSQPPPTHRQQQQQALANDYAEYPQQVAAPPAFSVQELSNALYPPLQPRAADVGNPGGAVGGEIPDSQPDSRTVVGYIGSIEMPSDANMPNGRLASIRSAVRRLRVEQKIHTLVLMEVHDDSVRLLSNGGHVMATYPAEKVAFSGVCPDDKRFFGIVTVHSSNIEEVNVDDGSVEETESSSSCHVFMVDPDLRSHSMHINRARSLGFQCSVDLETNSCLEFPRSATPVLQSVSRLYRNRPGGLYDAAEISRGGGGQVFADPNFAPQRSNSNSSTNSDSGLGFGRDDAVYVVDMPRNHHNNHHQEFRWQGQRSEAHVAHQPPSQPYHHPHHPGARGFPGVGASFHAYHSSVDYSTSSNETSFNNSMLNMSNAVANMSSFNHSNVQQHSVDTGTTQQFTDKLNLRARPDPVLNTVPVAADQHQAAVNNNAESFNAHGMSADNMRRGVHKILQRRQQSGSDADSVHSNDSSHQMPPPRQAPPLPSRKPPTLPPKPNRAKTAMNHVSDGKIPDPQAGERNKPNPAQIYDQPGKHKKNSSEDGQRVLSQATSTGSTPHRLSPRAFPVPPLSLPANNNNKPSAASLGKRSVPVPIPQVPGDNAPPSGTTLKQPPPLAPKPSSSSANIPVINASFSAMPPPPSVDQTRNHKKVQYVDEEEFRSSREVDFKQPAADPADFHDPRRFSEGFALLKQRQQAWEHGSQDDSVFAKLGSFRLLSKHKKKQPLSNSHESLVASEAESTKQRLSNANSVAGFRDKPSEEPSLGCAASWAVSFVRLLNDKAGLATFTEFLKKEFSEENIEFWMTCEQFKQLSDAQQLKEKAGEIFEKHLSKRASDPVNVDSEARNAAEKSLTAPSSEMFNQAQTQIFQLMKQDSYVRFLKSDLYRSCVVAEMEGKPLPHTGETKPQPQPTLPAEKPEKKTLKKSKSSSGTEEGGEEKRRRSILPWNRIKSGKRVSKMSTEPDLRKASQKQESQTGRASLASTDLNTLSSHVTTPTQILEDVKNECVDEDKENTAENGDNLQFCRVILPDGSTTVIYACVGQSIRTALSKLCERRHLAMPAVDVFELGSDKALDLSQDVSALGNKEIKLEKRALFRLDLPNRKSVGVKAKPNRTIRDVFRPILHKYGFRLDKMVLHVSGVGLPLDTEATVATIDSQRVLVQTMEDFAAKNLTKPEWGGYESSHRNPPQQPSLRPSSAPPGGDTLSDITSRVFEDLLDGPQAASTHQFDELGILDPEQKQTRKPKSDDNRNSIFGFIRRNSVSVAKKEGQKTENSKNRVSFDSSQPIMHSPPNKLRPLHDTEDEKFFELLSRVQSHRLDDQRGLSSRDLELPDFLKTDSSLVISEPIINDSFSSLNHNQPNSEDLLEATRIDQSLYEFWDFTQNSSSNPSDTSQLAGDGEGGGCRDGSWHEQGEVILWQGEEQTWSHDHNVIPDHQQAEAYFGGGGGGVDEVAGTHETLDYSDPRLMQKSLKDLGFDYSYSQNDRDHHHHQDHHNHHHHQQTDEETQVELNHQQHHYHNHHQTHFQNHTPSTAVFAYEDVDDDDFIHCDVADFSEDSEGDLVDDLNVTVVLDATLGVNQDDQMQLQVSGDPGSSPHQLTSSQAPSSVQPPQYLTSPLHVDTSYATSQPHTQHEVCERDDNDTEAETGILLCPPPDDLDMHSNYSNSVDGSIQLDPFIISENGDQHISFVDSELYEESCDGAYYEYASDRDSVTEYTDSLPSPSTHVLLLTPETSPLAPPTLRKLERQEGFHEQIRSITPVHMDFSEPDVTNVKVTFV